MRPWTLQCFNASNEICVRYNKTRFTWDQNRIWKQYFRIDSLLRITVTLWNWCSTMFFWRCSCQEKKSQPTHVYFLYMAKRLFYWEFSSRRRKTWLILKSIIHIKAHQILAAEKKLSMIFIQNEVCIKFFSQIMNWQCTCYIQPFHEMHLHCDWEGAHRMTQLGSRKIVYSIHMGLYIGIGIWKINLFWIWSQVSKCSSRLTCTHSLESHSMPQTDCDSLVLSRCSHVLCEPRSSYSC